MFEDFYGVWANKDCELVRTGRFSYLFERIGDTVSATLTLLSASDNKITFDRRAMAIYDLANKQVILKAKDLLKGEELLIDNDTNNDLELNCQECVVECTPERTTAKRNGIVIEELIIHEGKLKLLTPGHKYQTLDPVERIKIVEPYDMMTANEDNVGACLQEWNLGSSFWEDEKGKVTTITINTNLHCYVFQFNNWWQGIDMVYCRAARVRSNNNGTVFAQNIRLMRMPESFPSWMAGDNLDMTRRMIAIDDSLFNPDACFFAPDLARVGIYWSLKSFDRGLITLHGCGQEYHYPRPKKISENIVEWFEYKDYQE